VSRATHIAGVVLCANSLPKRLLVVLSFPAFIIRVLFFAGFNNSEAALKARLAALSPYLPT
jgi:hypothetical protein